MAKSVVAFSLAEFDPTYTRVLVGDAIFRYTDLINLGTLEVITGFANFRESQLQSLGNLTSIGSDANFQFSELKDLGNLIKIGGTANFQGSQIKSLGNLTTIGRDAKFSESQISDLSNLETIGRNAYFGGSEIRDLGNLTTIIGDANFQFSELKDLGNLITIGGSAVFGFTEIKDLGNLTTIGGDANFYQSQIMDLRNLETIGRNAYFNDSEVKSLGNLTTIEGDADFRNSQIEDLGKLKTIKGFVSFDNKKLADQWKNRSSKDNFKTGGQSLSKTPAPKKDRVYGSKKNKPESSKDTKSAEKIEFNEKTLETIKNKVAEHNEKNPKKKVTLASAKAVVRRGMGAYSSTHRPTISGGKPNSRVAWGLARLNAFFYKIINGKSKSGKYSQDDDLINELGYKVKKYEIGGIFQGTPHDFNYYSTEYIGTGEGLQAFGWGLYFTEIKDIAKNYAKNEMLIQKEISRKSDNSALLWIYTNISDNVVDKLGYLKIKLKEFEELKKEYKKDTWDDKIEAYSNLIDIIQNYQGKIYSVTLFKGEKETDYHLIKWENPLIVDDLVKIFEEAEKIGGIEFKNGWELDEKYGLTNERGYKITGEEMYVWLSKQLGGDKEASLFLLRAGIDGIKYKAGTLSGFEDVDGYNYVIFDANDITIEGKEKYDEILAGKEKYADGGVFENSALFYGGFFTGIQRQGIGKSIIYDIFKNNPKLENILLYTQQDAIGFWEKLGGEIIKEGNDKSGINRYYVKINRNSINKSKSIKELGVSYQNIDTKKAEISKGEYAIKYGRQKIGFFFVDDLGTIKTDPKEIILYSSNKENYSDGGELLSNEMQKHISYLNELLKNNNAGSLKFAIKSIDDIISTETSSIDLQEYKTLQKEIKKNGVVPILIDESNSTIIDGNHRWKLLNKMGIKNIPVFELKANDNFWKNDDLYMEFDYQYKNETPLISINKFYADGGDIQAYEDAMGISEFDEGGETTPKKVYVSIKLQSKTEYVRNEDGLWGGDRFKTFEEKTFEELKKHQLVGIRGVSLSPNNVGDWFSYKDCLVVMNYDEFVKLNDATKVKYDDPYQLMANDLKIFSRLYGNAEYTDEREKKITRRENLKKIIEKIPFYFDKAKYEYYYDDAQKRDELQRYYYILGNYSNNFIAWIIDNEYIINSPNDLTERLIEFAHLPNSESGIDNYRNFNLEKYVLTAEDLLPIVMKGLVKAGSTYTDEAEVIINNKLLNLPNNTQLFFKKEDFKDSDLQDLIDKYELEKTYRVYSIKSQYIKEYQDKLYAKRTKRDISKWELGKEQLEIKKELVLNDLQKLFFDKSLDKINKILDEKYPSTYYFEWEGEETKYFRWNEVIEVQFLLNKFFEITLRDWKSVFRTKRANEIYSMSFYGIYNSIEHFLRQFIEQNRDYLENINIYHNENGDYLWLYDIERAVLGVVSTTWDEENGISHNELAKKYFQMIGGELTTYYKQDEIVMPSIYKDGGSVLLAPNGKPSNLTPEQYKLVRSESFKEWFGDWENDPENASKVVDENGEPLIVYHGSNIDFNVFENKPREVGRRKTSVKGFYFTKDKWSATQYAGSDGFVKSYFLKILNYPSKQDKEVLEYSNIDDYLFDYGKTINRFGYDGAIDVQGDFIVFEPNQIKLADGTNTTFDGKNPDIRFMAGGLMKRRSRKRNQ